MLSRAGRLAGGAWLRPTLHLRRAAGHICPLVPRPAVSAQSVLPAPLCLPQTSCRHGSSQAKNHATPQPVDPGELPARSRQPTSAEGVGKLVSATLAAQPGNILLEFEKPGGPGTLVAQLWLRDACQCHLCVSESSGQKRYATCDIPQNVKADSLRVLEDGGLEVSWANDLALGSDQHVSTYPPALLHGILLASEPYRRNMAAREIWDSHHFEKDSRSREISYADWMQDKSRFAEAFRNLHLWGLVVIRGVPQTEDAVEQVASRLGHLQATLYGPTWDVVSKPRAENVAYTNEFLCLHQDLMYLNKPPRVQVLHCLENGCEGGDSLFSDGLRAAFDLLAEDPRKYRLLASTDVDFHYAKGGHYWHHSHRTITTEARNENSIMHGSPACIRWAPPFQAPFWTALRHGRERSSHALPDCSKVGLWNQAAKVFRDSAEAPANMLQFRLQRGDCVVFDNWRVLHGRRAFDTASGRRHLRGTYIEDQAVKSTWIRLQREGLMFPHTPHAYQEEQRRAWHILGTSGQCDTAHVAEKPDGEAEA